MKTTTNPRQSWFAVITGGLVFIGGVGLIALVLWLQ